MLFEDGLEKLLENALFVYINRNLYIAV